MRTGGGCDFDSGQRLGYFVDKDSGYSVITFASN